MLNPIRISKTQNSHAPPSLNAPRSSIVRALSTKPRATVAQTSPISERIAIETPGLHGAETRFTRVTLQMTPRGWNWRDTLACLPYRASTKLARPSAFVTNAKSARRLWKRPDTSGKGQPVPTPSYPKGPGNLVRERQLDNCNGWYQPRKSSRVELALKSSRLFHTLGKSRIKKLPEIREC